MAKARQQRLPGMPAHRRRPRVMMHVLDAGPSDICVDDPGEHLVRFGCKRCGHEEKTWTMVASVTEGKRGKPCPVCNSMLATADTDNDYHDLTATQPEE